MCVHGFAGSRLTLFTAAVPVKMSSGPWPMKCFAIGAPTKAMRDQKDDEEPARDRDLVATETPPHELPVAAGAYRFVAAEIRPALDSDCRREPGAAGNDDFLFFLRHV